MIYIDKNREKLYFSHPPWKRNVLFSSLTCLQFACISKAPLSDFTAKIYKLDGMRGRKIFIEVYHTKEELYKFVDSACNLAAISFRECISKETSKLSSTTGIEGNFIVNLECDYPTAQINNETISV